MNVGILTLMGYNYGTFFQAFALKKSLESLGHNVKIINTANLPVIFGSVSVPYPLFSLKNILLLSSIWKEMGLSPMRKFDGIVIGSDIVWDKGSKPEYFGCGLPTDNIVTYAPSCGEATYKDVSERKKKGLRGIRKLSCRDKKTAEMIQYIVGRPATKVLDPAFLIDWAKYEKPIKSNNFILVYSYSGKNRKLCIEAKRLSKEINGITISPMRYIPWCDVNISNVTPFEFLSYIKKATYVITDSFHGTVFSIIYKKAFISIAMNHKVKDLLQTFDIDPNVLARYKGKINTKKSKRYLKSMFEV